MIFLDTTFIVGLFVSNDNWHESAVKVYNNIKGQKLVISKLVIAETVTIMKNKLKTKDIIEIYRNLPNFFEVIEDEALFDDAMNEFVKYDSSISFFDAMYVAIMKREKISKIASFDSDFDKIDNIVRVF